MTPPRSQIKICGITNALDAQLAVRFGADMLGFNFYPSSPRCLDLDLAGSIIGQLPPAVGVVGVFVNQSVEAIIAIARYCCLDWVQLHGDETSEQCRQLHDAGLRIIKALRIRHAGDLEPLDDCPAELILLDAYHPNLYGGSGQVFDWSWINDKVRQRILLAGGITPETIKKALAVGTYGIDLCSGVEKQPALKDPYKLQRLFEEIDSFYGNGSQ